MVVFTATRDELSERYAADPDLYLPLEVVSAVNERFPTLLEHLPDALPALHLDTTGLSIEQSIARVDAWLEAIPGTRDQPRGTRGR